MCCLAISETPAQYALEPVQEIACTDVKSQDRTGTCWSFSTVSFLESELIRLGMAPIDFSEMYIVRTIYLDKGQNYFLRQGKANFSQGSLGHDVIRALEMAGIVPEEIYTGLPRGKERYNHSQLESDLKDYLDNVIAKENHGKDWRTFYTQLLDNGLGGTPPAEFEYAGVTYTPQSFAASLSIDPDDYVSLTSFSHHPFYEPFILEIPDNYSNGSYYNLPLDDLQATVDHALENGYSISWDGDVSETGFSQRFGVAVVPVDDNRKDLFTEEGPELEVDQALRQEQFETFVTTDDHLMHLTGIAEDGQGNRYYQAKNSWGEMGHYKGFLYMSVPYLRLKTVGILLHKDGIPPAIKARLGL